MILSSPVAFWFGTDRRRCAEPAYDTTPVSEVVQHGPNALLFDFSWQAQLLHAVWETLEGSPDSREPADVLIKR